MRPRKWLLRKGCPCVVSAPCSLPRSGAVLPFRSSHCDNGWVLITQEPSEMGSLELRGAVGKRVVLDLQER